MALRCWHPSLTRPCRSHSSMAGMSHLWPLKNSSNLCVGRRPRLMQQSGPPTARQWRWLPTCCAMMACLWAAHRPSIVWGLYKLLAGWGPAILWYACPTSTAELAKFVCVMPAVCLAHQCRIKTCGLLCTVGDCQLWQNLSRLELRRAFTFDGSVPVLLAICRSHVHSSSAERADDGLRPLNLHA